MSFHYGVPPTHYTKFYDSGYETSSPQSSGEYVHYIPHQYDYATPIKGHRRKTSHTPVTSREGGWFSPAGSPPPGAHRYEYNVSPSKETTFVSYTRKRASSSANTPQPRSARKQSQPVHIYHHDDDVYERDEFVAYHASPTTTRVRGHGKRPSTDSYFRSQQDRIYEDEAKPRTRIRRSSTTTKSSPRKERTAAKPAAIATPEDAARAGIPAGYSIKNWDPAEEPIILLGSVFDANSLGRWIYDWTVYKCGASSPMADMAGDMWLLLIKLAGKIKRAKECVLRFEDPDERDTIYDFIKGGQRLWKSFKLLLKDCEVFMMRAAKTQGNKTMMGKNAGTEFVDSMFGKNRHLEQTEVLMQKLRNWATQFDVNCEQLLRHPPPRSG